MLSEQDVFDPLLQLLALFPAVKYLELGPVSKDTLKKSQHIYWEEVQAQCPELDEVMFEGFGGPPWKMDDLVKGIYPCAF